ncbi:MAG: sensor domain-containing diguanylate cyclase, partial [Comamonadaceae bacterium]
HRAGHWVWVQGHAVVVSRDAAGWPALIVGTHMDITGRRRERSALEHARDMLGRTGAMAQVGGWELEVREQRLHWSDEVYRIHEIDRETEPSVRSAVSFYAPEARPLIEAAVQAALDHGTPWDLELPFVTAQGRRLWVRTQGMAVHRRNGRTTLLAGAFQDITDRKRAELRVAESETRLRTITDNLPVLIAEFDTAQRFRFCNATYRDWLGADPEKMLGRTVQESVAPEYFERRRVYLDRALAGEKVSFEQTLDLPVGLRTLQSTYLPQRDAEGRVSSIYALTTDITALKDTERLLDAMARTDLLTGLPNRRHFDERLAEAAARSRRTGSALAVLYLDVDRFKSINDTHGHAAGDDVLCILAQRLRACLRETDLVARHAGDEFAILLEGASVPVELSVVGAKLLQAMEAPIMVQGEPLTVGISV